MNPPNNQVFWLKVRIEIDPILEESVIDYLVGVMGASVEQAVGGEGALQTLNAYLKEKNADPRTRQRLDLQLVSHLKELAEIFGVASAQITWEQIADQDWSNNWKVHFKPFVITEGLVIAPTWEDYSAAPTERVIVMDPGMAFGTGHHPTTSLSLEYIRELLENATRQRVLDVGTGTGILGMGAALFGAERVLGIDNDPEAVHAATANVALNHLDSIMEVTLLPLPEIKGQFDLIVANIIHDVLITMTDHFLGLLEPGASLVLSGILHGTQEENIIKVFTDCGLIVQGQKRGEEWVALHFATRPSLTPVIPQ